MRPPASLLLPLAIAASGCVGAWSGPPSHVTFGAGEVRISSDSAEAVLPVEVARSPQQHRVGLSGRSSLEESGMIFLFEHEQRAGTAFWMYRTSIPLTLALLDSSGTIREILEMAPCRSRFPVVCPRYRAAEPFHAALEVPGGYLTGRKVGVGARVTLRMAPGR